MLPEYLYDYLYYSTVAGPQTEYTSPRIDSSCYDGDPANINQMYSFDFLFPIRLWGYARKDAGSCRGHASRITSQKKNPCNLGARLTSENVMGKNVTVSSSEVDLCLRRETAHDAATLVEVTYCTSFTIENTCVEGFHKVSYKPIAIRSVGPLMNRASGCLLYSTFRTHSSSAETLCCELSSRTCAGRPPKPQKRLGRVHTNTDGMITARW